MNDEIEKNARIAADAALSNAMCEKPLCEELEKAEVAIAELVDLLSDLHSNEDMFMYLAAIGKIILPEQVVRDQLEHAFSEAQTVYYDMTHTDDE